MFRELKAKMVKNGNDKCRFEAKKWWQDPGSNRGHGDFQSPALPTELSRHSRGSASLAIGLACCFITLVLFFKIANFFMVFFAFFAFFALFSTNGLNFLFFQLFMLQALIDGKLEIFKLFQ